MKKKCSTCGGTGQVGFFQGESRFLLTWDECPQCIGTGLAGHGGNRQEKETKEKKSRSGKKKKG